LLDVLASHQTISTWIEKVCSFDAITRVQ